MADIVTGTVSGQVDMTSLLQGQADIRRETAIGHGENRHDTAVGHADIRHENAVGQSDIRRDSAMQAGDIRYAVSGQAANTNDIVKTAAWNVSDRVGTEADRIVGQGTAFFIAQQQNDYQAATALSALKANADLVSQRISLEIAASARDAIAASQLEAAKIASAIALGQATLERTLMLDGATTRELMNRQKYDDLSRGLIERNQELVECRGDSRYWQGLHGQSQFSSVASQLQAFQSQLQETRQGMVNFGTMSGAAGQQTSTANNVR